MGLEVGINCDEVKPLKRFHKTVTSKRGAGPKGRFLLKIIAIRRTSLQDRHIYSSRRMPFLKRFYCTFPIWQKRSCVWSHKWLLFVLFGSHWIWKCLKFGKLKTTFSAPRSYACVKGKKWIIIPYRAKLCRAKVTNFLKGDENVARRIISPDENFARQSFA